eukprot:COSAG04_NODE_1096_length_8305_cov_9.345235_3_plen_286_part_00
MKVGKAGGRAGLDADAIAAQFTSPPARVGPKAKAELRAEAEALLPAPTWGYASSADSFYPPVAVLTSEGADGLGTWYAVRVAQTLFRRRAPCFVCAMSPTDHPQTQHAFMMSKLPQEETQAAVALLSPAFFDDPNCLEQLHAAVERSLPVEPVLIAPHEALPVLDADMWSAGSAAHARQRLALAGGGHARLGADSPLFELPGDILGRVGEACYAQAATRSGASEVDPAARETVLRELIRPWLAATTVPWCRPQLRGAGAVSAIADLLAALSQAMQQTLEKEARHT